MSPRDLLLLAALLIAAEHIGFAAASASDRISDDDIMNMVRKHCVMCHSQNPSHTMFLNQLPPKGVVLDTIEDVRKLADRIVVQVVQLKRMPLGNETGLKDEERAKFGAWITGN